MAKQIGVIQFIGKVANVVGFKTYSGPAIRGAATSVKNPKSAGQNVQRMIMATTAIAMSYFSEICNNSVKGVAFGGPSLNYLRRVWMNMLRADIANQGGANTIYNVKGSQNLCINPYLLSKGTLRGINIKPFNVGMPVEIDAKYSATVSGTSFNDLFPNVKLGHQLTFVAAYQNTQTGEIYFGYARVAAKTNENPFIIPTGDEGMFKINPAAINTALSEGDWDKIIIQPSMSVPESITIQPYVAPGSSNTTPIIAAAVIVSDKKSGNRSTSYLSVASNITTVIPANWEDAAASYGATSSALDVPADAYLNNSVDTGIETPANSIELVKIYETGDSSQEPVERNFLMAGRRYTFVFNSDVPTSPAPSWSGNAASAVTTSVYGKEIVCTIGEVLQEDTETTLTIGGKDVFGGFVINV